jgi:Carboxypeptidase regulatory-like domain
MSKTRISRGCSTFLLLLMFFAVASAQEFRGTVTGKIIDPNSAVVPGATVTIKNLATNVTNTTKTNEEGVYAFLFLLPGKYALSATSEGFQTSSRENIDLNVDSRLTVDIQLEIGTQANISIVAGDEILERGSVTTGTVINSRQVEELPLPEGAVFTLVTQAPGVNYTGNPQFQGPTANGNLAAFRTNGAAGNQINLDGSPNLAFSGQVAFTPPSDSVQEFKVQTNSFDAQNGFTAGSTVNVALKSGTNQLHGSVYYFDRDRSRTANNFFSNRLGIERPERKYYRFGGVVNGPVYIPKIFNGKDRTFFLFAYEKQKDNVAEPTTFFTPTDKQKMGDFSEILSTTPIYDPTTGVVSGSNVVRTAFSGNVIPTNRLNTVALNYLRLYPSPNLPVVNGVGQYFSNMNLVRPYKSYLARIDHNINQNHKVFGKYYYSRSDEDRYNWLGQSDSTTRGFELRTNKGGNIDYTATLSSSLIFDIRGSYNEFRQQRLPANPISPEQLGFSSQALASFRGATVAPRFDFQSFSSVNQNTLGSFRADYNEGLVRPFNLFSLQPTFTQVHGEHSFRYGYDFRMLRENFLTNGYNAGRFLFDGTYTTPASNSSTALRNAYGRDLAAFLLGIPTASSTSLIDNPSEYKVRSYYHGFFFQDDWRVSQRLTLNLGLRYEWETGLTEAENRIITGFDTTTLNPLHPAVQANFSALPPAGVPPFSVIGGLLFADENARVNQTTDKDNFQPRVGVSYSLNDKTVIRGGFGIFTAPFQIQAVNQAGFSTPTLFVPSTNNGLTFIANLNNPFPGGVAPSPGSSLGLATFIGRDLITTNATGPTSVVLSHGRENAKYTRFVAGIQRELALGFAIEANYVHSRGSDLAVNRLINNIPTQFLNSGTAFSSTVQTFLNATVANPFRGLVPSNATYNAATIQRRLLLVPFPAFGNIAITEYDGTSTYNALQLQLIKRFTRGLSLNGSYTYSREREKITRLNPQDAELTEQVAANDRPHRITFSAIYELPIGRNRAWGTNWNGWLDAFLGGWQVQANYERQSGEPLLLGNVYFEGDPSTLENKLGKKDQQGRRYGVDIPAFDIRGFYPGGVINTGAAAIGLGNIYTISGSNTLRYFPLALDNFRNQRFLNFNVGMSKNFRINESMKFQVRVEAINALNNPYFNPVILTPTSSTFGFTNGQRQPPRDIQLGAKFTF